MDDNLKLAIINQLIRNGLYNFDKVSFYKNVLGKEFNSEAYYNYTPDEMIKNYFISIDINKFDLKPIRQFSYMSGEPIMEMIWPFWDGEDDYFHIRSFEGIELCPNINEIVIDMYSYINDFYPLIKLKKLEKIEIEYNWEPEPVKSLDCFLKMSNLKKLSLTNIKLSNNINLDKLINSLKIIGVEANISLYP